MILKANSRATVHRPAYLDYVGVKTFDAEGKLVAEGRPAWEMVVAWIGEMEQARAGG